MDNREMKEEEKKNYSYRYKINRFLDAVKNEVARLKLAKDDSFHLAEMRDNEIRLEEWECILTVAEKYFSNKRTKTKYGFEEMEVFDYKAIEATENIHSTVHHYSKRHNILIKARKIKDGWYMVERLR